MQREGKHALSHTAIYLVARGLPGVLAFAALPLFTRMLSPEVYGRYFLVMTTATLLNALLFQWIRLSLVRYLPAHRDDPAHLKSTAMSATFALIAALAPVAGMLWLLPIRPEWKAAIFPCWLLMAVQAIFDLCCENARGTLRPWNYMALQFAKAAGTVFVGYILVLSGAGWWGPLIGLTIGMGVASAFMLRRDWPGLNWHLNRDILKQIARYGLPLSLTVALANVIGGSDRYLLAWLKGDSAAGLYSVGVDFTTQTLTLVMMVVNLAMFPLALRAFEQHGRQAAQDQMRSNASLLLAIGIPCVVGLSVLAPGIANCFLGKEYRATAATIIPLIALGAFLAGFKAYHFDAAFQFAHRTIYQVWIVLFVAIVNIALNWIAIPRYGINGAAGASVIAYVISIGLTAWLGRRHFILPFPIQPCAQVLLAGGTMALLLYPLRGDHRAWAVGLQIVAGAIVYLGVLLCCNFLGLREILARKWRSGDSAIESSHVTGVEVASTLIETQH